MASLERPQFRVPLNARRVDHDGAAFVAIEDPRGVLSGPVAVPMVTFQRVLCHFDGSKTLPEIQAAVLRETGQFLALAALETLVRQLDEALVLDGPRFEEFMKAFRAMKCRPAAYAGRSYAGTERALRAQLSHFFAHENGAGTIDEEAVGDGASSTAFEGSRFRGVISPHIDFARGGPTYTHAYRALLEGSDADVFVILGVAHQACTRRFVLTRKDFETPLGVVTTNKKYVDRIAEIAGDIYFDDELAHHVEHSIEFQVVFLQHILGERRPFTIVPILVGSFHDLMARGVDPIADPEVAAFAAALRTTENESGKRVAYIGGVDLCHVGPEFGDPLPLEDEQLEQVRGFDSAMLGYAAEGDAAGWFATASQVGNRLRVCGLAATYVFLHALGPTRGRVLRYDQAVDDRRTSCVSLAGMAFESRDASAL
ncbi:MAG: AmmeMemoRadiSam system protein B [Planctomycetota bacterium]|nr:AmmeMemoRadiSam system protein B [Planctomycetota bacterium]